MSAKENEEIDKTVKELNKLSQNRGGRTQTTYSHRLKK